MRMWWIRRRHFVAVRVRILVAKIIGETATNVAVFGIHHALVTEIVNLQPTWFHIAKCGSSSKKSIFGFIWNQIRFQKINSSPLHWLSNRGHIPEDFRWPDCENCWCPNQKRHHPVAKVGLGSTVRWNLRRNQQPDTRPAAGRPAWPPCANLGAWHRASAGEHPSTCQVLARSAAWKIFLYSRAEKRIIEKMLSH